LVRGPALRLQSGIHGLRHQNEVVGFVQTNVALAHFIAGLHANEVAHPVLGGEHVTEGIVVASKIQIFDIGEAVMVKPFRHLVTSVPFLSAYVDATASNVNLSAKSRMIWSMSAVRMFVAHIVEHHSDSSLSEDEKTKGAEEFLAALVRHLPQLKALDKARKDPASEVTTGSLREAKGGDVALRGVGMAIFARAFLHCIEHDVDFEVMAAKLATIDWHLLACERSDLPQGPTFGNEVRKNAQPLWAHLLIIGEARYRVSSSSVDVDTAWEKISAQVLNEARNAA
jgi:DndB-like DNA-sulfur modification-associated protein